MPEATHPTLAPLVALAEEWERSTVPARLAFLVAADELRAAIAEASALLGEVRDTDRLVLVPGSPEVAQGLRALLDHLGRDDPPSDAHQTAFVSTKATNAAPGKATEEVLGRQNEGERT